MRGVTYGSFFPDLQNRALSKLRLVKRVECPPETALKKLFMLHLIEVAGLLSSYYKRGKPLACSPFYTTTHTEYEKTDNQQVQANMIKIISISK